MEFANDLTVAKSIEEIRPGDTVLSWCERTGRNEWKSVSRTFVSRVNRVSEITLESQTSGDHRESPVQTSIHSGLSKEGGSKHVT